MVVDMVLQIIYGLFSDADVCFGEAGRDAGICFGDAGRDAGVCFGDSTSIINVSPSRTPSGTSTCT